MNLSEPIDLAVPRAFQLEPVGPAKAPALMSLQLFRALLDEQPELKKLHLHGAGEPLAHPYFFDMVSYAAARGIEVSTKTSLLTISDARIDECIASGLARLELDPGAAQPLDCDYLRPGAKLRRGLRNLQRIAARRAKGRPRLCVVLALLRSNLPHLPELIRLSRAHGADVVRFRDLWHDVSAARRFVEAESLLGESVDFSEARATAQALGLALELPAARPCDRPWRMLTIGASGEALPCEAANTAQRGTLGNVRREGVVQVWNNEAYRAFRERFASSEPPQLCRRCSAHETAHALRA